MIDKNLARLKRVLAQQKPPAPPPRAEEAHPALLDLARQQSQLETEFLRLVDGVIQPTLEEIGSLLGEAGHGHLITRHDKRGSEIFSFVIDTTFDWDVAISLHIGPGRPRFERPSASAPAMAFMMGQTHTRIYYKSNLTDELGRQSDKFAFELVDLTRERIELLLIRSIGKLLTPARPALAGGGSWS